jgi:hypothetical protein
VRSFRESGNINLESWADNTILELDRSGNAKFELVERQRGVLPSGDKAVRIETLWQDSTDYCLQKIVLLLVATRQFSFSLTGYYCDASSESYGFQVQNIIDSFDPK